jgi:AcrR family transcriptional regulator
MTGQPESAPPRRGVDRALAPVRDRYEREFDRLVSAARAVIARTGTVEPTVGEILREAGLSTTSFYRHFPTKDDLLLTLVMEAAGNTRSYLRHRMATADATARIVAWITGMFDLLGTDEALRANRPFLLAHTRLLEAFPDEMGSSVDLLVEPLASAIAEARAQRSLPRGKAAHDAALVHHQVFGILLDTASLNRITDQAVVKRVVTYSLRALLSPDPA